MNKLIWTFAILSFFNVIFSTTKSILTLKSNKYVATIVNGLYFTYYNIVLIYTVSDFDMTTKCIITFFTNIFGVFLVKYIEERMEKDKLRVYDVTAEESVSTIMELHEELKKNGIKSVYMELAENLCSIKIFSNTKAESKIVDDTLKKYNVAFHVLEAVAKRK